MQLSNSLIPRSSASSGYLLRQYGGAAAAYSLQRLDTSSENVVRVRESVGDTEADFTAEEVSGGALREFALQNDADLIRFANQSAATDKRMYFDGAGDQVRAAGIDAGETGDFTASCYFMPSSFGAFEQIISNSNGTSAIAFELRLDVSGTKLQAGMTIGGSFKSATGSTAMSLGTIYRVGIRRASNELEVWLDGVKDGSATHIGARDAQSIFCVGCRNNSVLFTNGVIYDLKYWDSAISEADMLADGTGGTPSTSPTSHLQGYGNTNADWEDQVGSNDGTVQGSPALFSGQGFDAFVTTWYDQSGNGRDATQATAASQPQIVADGVVVTDANGNAAITNQTANSNIGLNYPIPARNIYTEIFVTLQAASSQLKGCLLSDGNNASAIWGIVQDGSASPAGASVTGDAYRKNGASIASPTRDDLHTEFHDGAINVINGYATHNDAAVWDGADVCFFQYGGSPAEFSPLCVYGEIVVYNTDQSANRATIEANIASRYGITLA